MSLDEVLPILAYACAVYVLIINLVEWLLLAASIRELQGERSARGSPSWERADRVCVIIACYNERVHLSQLLGQLADQMIVPSLRVIVADDGSIDGTPDLAVAKAHELADRLDITILRLPRRGKGAAIDDALKLVDSPLVALLDADVQLAPTCLATLRDALAPGVDAVSPLVMPDPDIPPSGVGSRLLMQLQAVEYLRTIVWRPGWQYLGAAGGIEGRLGLFRTEALSAAGPFAQWRIAVDYEISAALLRRVRGRRNCLRTAIVEPVRTAIPTSWKAFAAQRRRWFLGLGDAQRRNRVLPMLRAGAYARAAEYLLRDLVHPWPFVEASWWVIVAATAARQPLGDAAAAFGVWAILTLSAAGQLMIARRLWRTWWPAMRATPAIGTIALFAWFWQPIRALAVVTGMLLQPRLRRRLWSSERVARPGASARPAPATREAVS